MLKKIGRILVLILIIIAGIFTGTLISTVCMDIIENMGNIHMTEYFETSMSGSVGILSGTGLLFLYMKKQDMWNVSLKEKEKLSVKKACVYSVLVVCICKFVFEVISAFVLSRVLPNTSFGFQEGSSAVMYSAESIILTVFGLVAAPAAEEILFRKCLYAATKKEFGMTAAMIVNIILFAVVHSYGIQGFLSCMLAGFIFAYLYERTGNIWYSISAHIFCNIEAYLSGYMEKIEIFGKPLCYEVNGYNTYHAAVFVIAFLVIVLCVGSEKYLKR